MYDFSHLILAGATPVFSSFHDVGAAIFHNMLLSLAISTSSPGLFEPDRDRDPLVFPAIQAGYAAACRPLEPGDPHLASPAENLQASRWAKHDHLVIANYFNLL